MDAPDPAFVEHVAEHIGVDPDRLRIRVIPNQGNVGNFAAWELLDSRFQRQLSNSLRAVDEVVALWPSPAVAWLVKGLGLPEALLPGAQFLREGGGELANSKALFRPLAAGAGVPIPLGGVCHCADDAFRVSGHLLHEGHAFMVKRSFAGGGAGNEIVATRALEVSHAGHSSVDLIEATSDSLREYWERRWEWASSNGTQPVVVEVFVPGARTVYVEVLCTDQGVGSGHLGELQFDSGRIRWEVYPAKLDSAMQEASLRQAADRLARAYQAVGYRGYLSLDAILVPDGGVFFTEANARFTGSTHLYAELAHRVVGAKRSPPRVIVQFTSPGGWQVHDLGDFLRFMTAGGLAYNPRAREGILAITPPVRDTGQLVLAAVSECVEGAQELVGALDRRMSQYSGEDL